MKKPTLAQLKKRPSLWIFREAPRIVYPKGKMQEYLEYQYGQLKWRVSLWDHSSLLSRDDIEFIGWL